MATAIALTDTLFELVPAEFEHRPAAVSDGNTTLSGIQLRQECENLARQLLSAKITRAALLARNSATWVIADLACQMARISSLPLPGFFSLEQKIHALNDSGVELMVCDSHCDTDYLDFYRWLTSHFARIHSQADLDIWQRSLSEKGSSLPKGTGKITYTSGSTGAPKGVCLGNNQLLVQARALAEKTALHNPKHLCLLPLSVLLENVAGLYTALVAGGKVLVPDQALLGFSGSTRVNAEKLLNGLTNHNPDSIILTPQLLALVTNACDQGWQPPPNLKFIAVGGSRVSAELIAKARHFKLPVYEGYGLSECASVVSLNTPNADLPGSAGKPLDHLRVSIRDGEVMVAGNSFLGYVGDPSSWNKTTVATGDIGHLDGRGFLHLDGRKKNLIINSFGRNISPEWVESEVMSGDVIDECLVFGDAKPWLVALILPGKSADKTAIEQWLSTVNERLPDYARIHQWHQLDAPMATINGLFTSTGKPRREAICAYFHREIAQLYAAIGASNSDAPPTPKAVTQ
ncbi:MAG: AMP-binding protein [Porticoccaceae bacterium]|nr:AMP-binding protein [Porticoccaceae bacterium]